MLEEKWVCTYDVGGSAATTDMAEAYPEKIQMRVKPEVSNFNIQV